LLILLAGLAKGTRMTNLQELDARIAASPYNQWLGLRAVAIDPGGVTLEADTRPEMLGNPDTELVHGGVVSALIDATCSYAWLANEGGFVSTVDLRTDFHRPLPKGRVTIRADIVRAGRSIITVDARLTDADGRLMASGRAVMMRGSKVIAGSAG